MREQPLPHTPSEEASLSNIKNLIKKIFSNVLTVSLLEFRGASVSLTTMIGAAVTGALLLLTLWELLTCVIGVYMYQHGISLLMILGALIVMQIILAIPVFFIIYLSSKKLLFPATRQAISILKRD